MKRIAMFLMELVLVLCVFTHTQAKEFKIKPGVTITPENYKEYLPELKEMMDINSYLNVSQALERGLVTLPIKEKVKYPQEKYFHQATVKNAGKARVGPDNQLLSWTAGLPFPQPKNGAELAWNVDRRNMTDNYHNDGTLLLVDHRGRLERKLKWAYWAMHYNGRVKIPPMPEITGNKGYIRKKQALVMMEPFDVKGFGFVRVRYEDVNQWDDMYIYVPALRRMRRMTGADTADPLLGTDGVYDDFEFYCQKITSRMTFEMEEREMLVHIIPLPSGQTPAVRPPLKGNQFFQLDWHIRPMFVLAINVNDPEYPYSKRVLIVEKERMSGVGTALNTYDQKGRLFRGEYYIENIKTGPGFYGGCWYAKYNNFLSDHSTVIRLNIDPYDERIKQEHLTFKYLLKQAR